MGSFIYFHFDKWREPCQSVGYLACKIKSALIHFHVRHSSTNVSTKARL